MNAGDEQSEDTREHNDNLVETYLVTMVKPANGVLGMNLSSDCVVTSFGTATSCALRAGVASFFTALPAISKSAKLKQAFHRGTGVGLDAPALVIQFFFVDDLYAGHDVLLDNHHEVVFVDNVLKALLTVIRKLFCKVR